MTKRLPNLVRLLVVLAIVSSLVAITAVPVSAGTVTAVTVTTTPVTAATGASYTIAFTTATDVGAGGTITVAFPSGVTLPSTISRSLIALTDGAPLVFSDSGDPDPIVSGQSVIITIPPGETLNNGGITLTISQAAGIVNPALAKTQASLAYGVSVTTSTDLTSGTGYLGTIPTYSVSPTTTDRNATVEVTGKGWAASQVITIGGSLDGSGTIAADGTFTVTADTVSTGNVTIIDGSGQSFDAVSGTTAGGIVTWDSTPTIRSFTMKARVIVSPSSGNVGSTVTVLGYDFTSGGAIGANSVTLGGTALTHGAYTLTTRDAYGTLDDAVVSVSVPANAVGGAKTVSITDGTKTATATFTVNSPTVTLDPTTGSPNSMVTITGANFQAADTIQIGNLDFASANWNTSVITVDASGSWTYSKLSPAGAVSGANPVDVTTAAGTTASATFTVAARSLTLSPTSGPSGTQVTTSGPNMTAAGTIAVGGLDFAGANWNTAVITIDSLGNISPTTRRVPNGSATGSNTVLAVDSGTLSATAVFTVTQPTIEISPSSGSLGDTVTVTGAGWVPGSLGLVTITFNATTQAVTTPDADGAFTAQFQIPSTAVSGQLVDASDGFGNNAADKSFLISAASISIDPATGPPGTSVTVTGVGFLPTSAVTTLTIGGGNVLPTTPVITSALGGFNTTFTVPGLGSGAQTVSATVVSTTATSFFTITAAEATVSNVTASIASSLVRIWGYSAGAWQMYDPADTIGSDLATLTEGRGYWVNVTEAASLVYLGKSRTLDLGWNLMGW
ncbi:MAG: hypothetical protein V3S14_02715 [Anaerolineae bacterium]